MDRINIGIVGTGWWASVHANAIKKGKFLKLVACYSRTKEKAKEFAVKNDCEVVSDYMSLIKRTDIDAIIITTPHTTHPELAIKAAQAGKHVLIEKPLALNVKDCKRIIEAFEDAGLVLAVGHDRRWYGSHMKMKELIEKGVIGKRYLVKETTSIIQV
jgi:Predicted dehydrogenases and related proteins